MDKIYMSTTEEKQINLFKMMVLDVTRACTRYHQVNLRHLDKT
jgi:hypothetical protein